MAHVSKRMKAARSGLDRNQVFGLAEAIKMVKERATAKFDETVEVAINLNVDPRKADQALRGMVNLPHGTGKKVTVCVFARGPKAEEAKKAGAEIVGGDELVDQIQNGSLKFDRCIATPDMMGVVGKLGKVLGPRGLMPNPKLGTVTMDVAAAVESAKSGQIEYRTDKAGVIHAGVGKVSFSDDKIIENLKTFVNTIAKVRPAGVKGTYMKKVAMSSTMGPGLTVDMATVIEE